MKIHKSIWWFAALLVFASIPVQASLIKWTDAQGRVHYSDVAPRTIKSKTLQLHSAPAHTPSASRPRAYSVAEQARIKAQNCAVVRNQLDTLRAKRATVSTHTNNETPGMDTITLDRNIADAEEAIHLNCD
jgi:hypothetical protein